MVFKLNFLIHRVCDQILLKQVKVERLEIELRSHRIAFADVKLTFHWFSIGHREGEDEDAYDKEDVDADVSLHDMMDLLLFFVIQKRVFLFSNILELGLWQRIGG